MSDRAIVIGAGIAGLATAHALEGLGYDVRVIERDATLPAEGAGLTLWPNATRALSSLGLEEAASACALTLREAATLAPDGSAIAKVPLRLIEQRFGPLISVHRAEFLSALRESFSGDIEFSTPVTAKDGRLWAGDSALEAELIVGADGIGSVSRALVAPHIAPRSAGYGAWRGVAKTGTWTPNGASETIGRGKRFGLVPLARDRTYWFAVVAEDVGRTDLPSEFADWHEPISKVLASAQDNESSYLPIMDLPRLPRWHHEQIVLVGDAAHAMTPNLGQGAAQALEDVAALARHVESRDLPVALAGYVRERKRRAERVVARSRAIGRIAQASNPLTAMVRDRLARTIPDVLAARQLATILGD